MTPPEVPRPRVVVDTDVLSFRFRKDTRAVRYAPHLRDRPILVSFMALAELNRWALQRNWGPRRRARMAEFLRPFATVHSDDELCL